MCRSPPCAAAIEFALSSQQSTSSEVLVKFEPFLNDGILGCRADTVAASPARRLCFPFQTGCWATELGVCCSKLQLECKMEDSFPSPSHKNYQAHTHPPRLFSLTKAYHQRHTAEYSRFILTDPLTGPSYVQNTQHYPRSYMHVLTSFYSTGTSTPRIISGYGNSISTNTHQTPP